jgi:hypothetical protein
LTGVSVQEEESLRLFCGGLVGGGSALDHIAFGVADQTVGIQSQESAREVSTGAA